MKKTNKLILLICVILINTACNDKGNKIVDAKSQFDADVNSVINIIVNDDISKYQSDIVFYNVENNVLYASSYNVYTDTIDLSNYLNVKLDNYTIKDVIVVKKNNGDMYASIENDEYCAIKDFADSEISIYSITNENKCHKFGTLDGSLKLGISAFNIEDNTINYGIYIPGMKNNGYIKLVSVIDLVDPKAINYRWYRNGEEIKNSNVSNYYVTLDQEDADYYVEIITNDGQTIQSEPVNVKINRN